MRSSIVDVDARMQKRIILAYRIDHNLTCFSADGFDVIDITLDNDGVVHGDDEACCGASEVLIKANHGFAKHNASGRLDGGVNQLVDGLMTARRNVTMQSACDRGVSAHFPVLDDRHHRSLD